MYIYIYNISSQDTMKRYSTQNQTMHSRTSSMYVCAETHEFSNHSKDIISMEFKDLHNSISRKYIYERLRMRRNSKLIEFVIWF